MKNKDKLYQTLDKRLNLQSIFDKAAAITAKAKAEAVKNQDFETSLRIADNEARIEAHLRKEIEKMKGSSD